MKVHELIKLAVEKEDWLLICAAYEAITGEKIEPPKKEEKNLLTLDIDPEIVKKLGLGDSQEEPRSPGKSEEVVEDFKVTPSAKKQDGEKKKRTAKKEPITPQPRINKFQDDLTLESKDLKKNNPILSQIYSKVPPRQISEERKDSKYKVDVVCSYCGLEDQVVPGLAIGYSDDEEENTYKCNSCCTPEGRLKVDRARERGDL